MLNLIIFAIISYFKILFFVIIFLWVCAGVVAGISYFLNPDYWKSKKTKKEKTSRAIEEGIELETAHWERNMQEK